MAELDIKNWIPIGRNTELGYDFYVGQITHKWIGFAVGVNTNAIFLFAQISDRNHELGLTDQKRVILLTGEIAQDDESGYGGVTHWLVPVELRGDPEKMRCKHCGEIVCEGDCEAAEEAEFYGDHFEEELKGEEELGPCCICEGTEGVHNIIMLEKKGEPGKGWGCVVCDLPFDGASTVLCDPCFTKWRAKEVTPRFACKGYLKSGERIPFEELTGEYKHDPSKHPELRQETEMSEQQTIKKEFTFTKEPGRYTWAQKNLSHNPIEIRMITIEGKSLRLLSVQAGVGGCLSTKEAAVELELEPPMWYPLLDLFIEVESAEACEVKVILEVIEHPGESGFESPLD